MRQCNKKSEKSEYQFQLYSGINNCNNLRKWWKIIDKLLRPSHDHDVPPLIVNGQVYENDKDKVYIFNEFFCKQTEIDESSSHLPNCTASPSVSNNLSTITLSQEEVYIILNNLYISKASDPDLISHRLLKETASVISYPLYKIFSDLLIHLFSLSHRHWQM